MKKVVVVGHFGFGHDLLNGQTIKTKIVANEIEKNVGINELKKIDTRGGFLTLVKLPFLLLYSVLLFRNIVVLPAQNGLRIIAPLLAVFNLFFGRKTHYVVVGGWLPEFLRDKPFLTKSLKSFDFVYVETNVMKLSLESLKLKNVVVMPNCKDLKILDKKELNNEEKRVFQFCTFSRVMKEKGIEESVSAIKIVNVHSENVVCCLDVYGQIEKSQEDWFDRLKSDFPEFIRYKGIVQFDKSVDVLKQYDMLLFPTFYKGEGFPGTLIDSYAAGVPVIASDWHYNKEIVDDGIDGFIVPVNNVDELASKIEWCLKNQDVVCKMKEKCLLKARNFLPEYVMKPLISSLA